MKALKLLIGILFLSSVSFATSADYFTGTRTISDGVTSSGRSSKDGSVVTQEGHAKYQEAAYRGNVWSCSNYSAVPVTTKAGLDASNPMLTLYNPVGSGKALVMLETAIDITASPAGATGVSLAWNVATSSAGPTLTSTATYTNAILANGGAPPATLCYRAATLVAAPQAFRYIGGTTGASAIGGYTLNDNEDGKVIIPPGVAVSIQTTAALAGVGHFVWEEIPYP